MKQLRRFAILLICFIVTCIVIEMIGNFFNNDIDHLIKKHYESNDTIISLADLYQEDWDTVYFFGACSWEDIDRRLGRSYDIWEDLGDKMLILNNRKRCISQRMGHGC